MTKPDPEEFVKSTAVLKLGEAVDTICEHSSPEDTRIEKSVHAHFAFRHLVLDEPERKFLLKAYRQAFEELLLLMLDRFVFSQSRQTQAEKAIEDLAEVGLVAVGQILSGNTAASGFLYPTGEELLDATSIRKASAVSVVFSLFHLKDTYQGGGFSMTLNRELVIFGPDGSPIPTIIPWPDL